MGQASPATHRAELAMREMLLIWWWGHSGLRCSGPQFLSLDSVLMAGGKVGRLESSRLSIRLCGPRWSSLLLRLFPHLSCDVGTGLSDSG